MSVAGCPRVLVAYDGSPSATRVIERTAALVPGADAVVCSVADHLSALDSGLARAALPDSIVAEATGDLRHAAISVAEQRAEEGAAAARELGLQAMARGEAADGAAQWALLDVGRRQGIDLVACGSHSRGALGRALLGSVSTALLQHSTAPVLIVPPTCDDDQGPLVVGWDGSPEAERALQACARLFAGHDICVVHVWESPMRHSLFTKALHAGGPREMGEVIDTLDADLAERHAQTVATGVTLAQELGLVARGRLLESEGPPSHEVLTIADELRAGAIVVGRRGRNELSAAVTGSVSGSLVHAGERPVLVVP